MKLNAKIKSINGNMAIYLENQAKANFDLYALEGCEVVVSIEKRHGTRTDTQNSAIHVYFKLLSDALNDAGYDMKKVIKQEIDIPWTPDTVKNNLWRPIQMAYLDKKSTTRLNKMEIDKVYEILNKVIGERTGIYIPFPSNQNE